MISCVGLHKSFGDVSAISDVSFTIQDGTFLGLLGPNGAGKTSLIRLMIGLLEADLGCVMYDECPITKDAIETKKTIGVVSQHVNLDKELTVEENMHFMGRLYHMPKSRIQERTDELLEFFGLTKERTRLSKTLSGGMKRKLMIAKAIIHDPLYIFLDEPTVGIDINYRKEIWAALKQQHNRGKTIVLTSHYIEEIEYLCDRVMLIDEGKIFKDSNTHSLINELGAYKVEYFENDSYRAFHYPSIEDAKKSVAAYEGSYKIADSTLEDVFFHYTSKKVREWK